MQKYTVYLPDDVVREIDAQVQALKANRPKELKGNIGRGTVIVQAWRHLKQSQPKT